MVGLKRSVYYYNQKGPSQKTLRDLELIKSIALKLKHIGNKKIAAFIRKSGVVINHKRVERLRSEYGLVAKPKKKIRKRMNIEVLPIPEVKNKNDIWAIDFMSSRKGSSLRYRLFNVIDVHSKICPSMEAARMMRSEDVIKYLDEAIKVHGKPNGILSDNGTEFRCETYINWAREKGINIHFTKPARPVQNCFIESFNSCVRREFLNDVKTNEIEVLKLLVENWRTYYNEIRPHGTLDYWAPIEYQSKAKAKEVS